MWMLFRCGKCLYIQKDNHSKELKYNQNTTKQYRANENVWIGEQRSQSRVEVRPAAGRAVSAPDMCRQRPDL